MTRTRVELLGGPDCGKTPTLTMPAGGPPPDTLPDHDGRLRYRAAYREKSGQHIYVWQPEHPARPRPACVRHPTPRPGCPGYQPAAKPP